MKTQDRQQEELLALLHVAAERGEPCPSNQAIADHFGYASQSAGARLIEQLERAGRIVVQRFHKSRVVEIVGETIGGSPLRTHDARKPAPVPPPTPAAPPPSKPRVSAAVIRAAKVDGRDLPTFVTALIDMGLDCWRDERLLGGQPVADGMLP